MFFPPPAVGFSLPVNPIVDAVGAALFGGAYRAPPAPPTTRRATGAERHAALTLDEVYARHLERGGNRVLEAWALAHLGSVAAASIDRDFLHKWAPRLYPKLPRAERVQKFEAPLAEILDLPPAEPGTDAWWAQRKLEKDAADERERQRFMEWIWPSVVEEAPERNWSRIEYYGHLHGDPSGGWAKVHTPGPPPDPPSENFENFYPPISAERRQKYDDRGYWRPSAAKAGRPRKYSSDAEKHRAYRRRKKQEADK